jgi:hypothetical protein
LELLFTGKDKMLEDCPVLRKSLQNITRWVIINFTKKKLGIR